MATANTQFYRDASGNILNQSGNLIMTANTVANMGPEYQQRVLAFPTFDTQSSQQGQQQEEKKDPFVINSSGSPYFQGDHAVVNYQGIPMLIDKDEKTLRPYMSYAAYNNLHDTSVEDLAVLEPQALEEDGIFGDYNMLGREYAVQYDGTFKEYDASKIMARYGKSIDQNMEKNAYMAIDGFIDLLNTEDSGLSEKTLKKVTNDPEVIAKYINALAYGGYTLTDIYRDMAKEDLIESGENRFANVSPISTNKEKSEYITTREGQRADDEPLIQPPSKFAGIDTSTMNLPIWSIPDEVFKTLVPMLDYDSEEFQDAVDEIESAYHDVIMQQLEAQTDQEKAIADYNYSEFKKEVEKKYGIILSDNAVKAWDQIAGLREEFNTRGLAGSGIERESIDDYLKRVRRQDQRAREERMTTEEAQKASYYLKYASPEEIQELINSDEEFAQKMGLIPSDEVKEAMSFDTLREKYPPEVTDEELMDYISTILDENGNYRSNLYQNHATKALQVKQNKRTYQEGKVMENYLKDEEKAYADYTMPDSPFLRYKSPDKYSSERGSVDLPEFDNVKGSGTMDNVKDKYSNAREAAENISKSQGSGYKAPKTSSNKYILTDPQGKQREISKSMADSYSQGANKLASGFSVKPASSFDGNKNNKNSGYTVDNRNRDNDRNKRDGNNTNYNSSSSKKLTGIDSDVKLSEKQKKLLRSKGYSF